MSIPSMTDMAKTNSEKMADMTTGPCSLGSQSDYDYGLSISLNNESLEKLDLSTEDVEVGDFLHIHALAKVTSVSKRDTGEGSDSRIELCLTHISAEDESDEDEEAEDEEPLHKKLYKKK